MKKIMHLLSSALFTGFLYAGSAYAETEGGSKEVAPSAAEKRVIQNRIDAVRNGQERAAIESQSAVWKMTTFLCQDAARAVLKKRGSGRRFFLQDDQPESQVFVGPDLLTGRGQFSLKKDPMQWVPFTWACHLNPQTAKVVRFDVTPVSKAADVSASQPVCKAKELHLTVDDQNGAFNGMSHSGTMVTLKNVGATPCSVPAYPVVELQDSAGNSLPAVRQKDGATASDIKNGQPQGKAAITLPAAGEVHTALRWVSGDVYDDSHNCMTAAALQVKWDDGRQIARVPVQAHVCAPAHKSAEFEQAPLSPAKAAP
ncbi:MULTISPECIES: DUF4232 domain-containing protein [Acetobacter]|nr:MULTISPECIES: DUF4232 domain-containing protein [Acetobacter]MBC9010303.1 DUF4232 domain-containing protein [Acetobacter tropicalis]